VVRPGRVDKQTARNSMTEVWLKGNRRVLLLGMVMPLVLVCGGGVVALGNLPLWARSMGLVVALVGLTAVAVVARHAWLPRLAYADRHLLVYARSGPPYRVPIETVEGFLLGQGPTMLPGKQNERTEARTVVIRLAEAATDWADRELHPSLGRWCGGYITLRGTWCEPLSVELVGRLNQRLYEVSRIGADQSAAEQSESGQPGSQR
jgi:hypothetical protein